MTIEKIVRKVRVEEQESDSTYWRQRPRWERLAALEQIRQEYHLWKYGSGSRFQRVYTIVKQ